MAFKAGKLKTLKQALKEESPLQLVGTINACSALIAEKAGFRALYLSGAGIANAAFGLPDLGLTTESEVAEELRRIRACTNLPILVDADTGFGSRLNVARCVKLFIQAGASGLHIEDQTFPKRCGHRAGKNVVSSSEMGERLKAALDARSDPDFVIMARTDAFAVEGLNGAIERAAKYVEIGADMIFAESIQSLEEYRALTKAIKVPVLANITEFGQTPLFTVKELHSVGVQLVLYPLTAFRAMNKAAEKVYQTLRKEGSQKSLTAEMQTREELYHLLNYEELESQLE